MKLNLGCGFRKLDGYVNVDVSPACSPDQVVDLEMLPWPWEDGSVTEVVMIHVLEHLGATPDLFMGIVKELYRVCRPGAQVTIVVPHPRHDNFLADPTHVRAILPETLQMLSKTKCREWQEHGDANTPLALYLDVDFELTKVQMDLDKNWESIAQKEGLTQADAVEAMYRYANVVSQIIMELRAVKG